jgi:hypothetical protein
VGNRGNFGAGNCDELLLLWQRSIALVGKLGKRSIALVGKLAKRSIALVEKLGNGRSTYYFKQNRNN